MSFLKSALLVTLTTAALAAHATSTPLAADDQWQTFGVDSYSALSGGTEWIDNDYTNETGYGTALDFNFTIGAGFVGQLTVVDASMAGDVFNVFNQGQLLGSTSSVAVQLYGSAPDVGDDHDAALLSSVFSRGLFALGAGNYSISGVLTQSLMLDDGAGSLSPINATSGALKLSVSAVPEPSTLVFALLGLAWLVAPRRTYSR
ncbi:PEP-CTERM sorting domain-containing protein [Aquabacterium sp.]|uniref:PEP-CTERM sorting domain-containing protein n=1 Tax=Aquabacterium sp. TaxID=1872578 RepID=UPI00198F2B06|nr:PEP-CTERM sorting domain-containing protein [Aquabacterium sp.]MBC7699239.1 hypothetical protein [Aquabacterium sp.]